MEEREGALDGDREGLGDYSTELNANALSLFEHELTLSGWEKVCLAVTGLVLVPIRLWLAVVVALVTWAVSSLGLVARNTIQWNTRPQDGWRGICRETMYTLTSTVVFFMLGFRVTIKGTPVSRREAPVIIAAPHTSFLDVFVISKCGGSPVARIENSRTPVMASIQQIAHTIFVDRKSAESRQTALEEIVTRVRSPLDWPKVFIFSEGTTTNGSALIRFQTGGFRAGVPVQPVTIQYSHPHLTTWTRDQSHGFLTSFLLLLATPVKTVTVTFLPVYHPNSEEKNDPIVFARGVQKTMALSLGLPATDIQRAEFVRDPRKYK